MDDIKNKFADLIMKHGAALTLAVAFIVYMDYKDSKHEDMYLKAISDLRQDKVDLHGYNEEIIREVIDCYKNSRD
tara:strand:+ start:519 stop:743 length:225 start_codon:yes stop_codon:yes gene_type:complete